MRLYQDEYGLTELRLYTTAFMTWLAALLLWFALTVLRDQRARFAAGALVAASVVLLILHTLNPDALIVRVNTANATAGRRPFDTYYANQLSADAVPTLVAALPTLPPADACRIARFLLRTWGADRDDWRNWSWSRARARESVRTSLTWPANCARLGDDRSP
jgi:hypothetical protein